MNDRRYKSAKRSSGGLTGKQVGLAILCTVLAVILCLLVMFTAYVESMLGLLNRNVDDAPMSAEEYLQFLQNQDKEEVDPNLQQVDPDHIQWGENVGVFEKDENVVNILLVGQDRRPGEGRTRSDSMILCTINKKTKTLTMTSFMRDMYVQIPGYYDDRINACYVIGGFELLDNCLQKNFGVQVDGNLEVDFYGFQDVINAMGGVDIELTEAEASYMNTTFGTAVSGGWNHLDGYAALSYSRIRYVGNGDFGRTNRQRVVLTALVEKCKGMSLAELNSTAKAILPLMTTDMTNAEIMDYIIDFFPMLTDLKIKTQRIPADGTYYDANIRDMSVLVPDLEANRQLLADAMAG